MVGIFAAIFGGTPTQASYWTNDSSACVQCGVWKQLWELYLSSSRWSFANYFGLNIAGYVKYFPVVSGFMSGVGLIIILLQLFPLWDSIRQNQPSQY
jgi:SulP family sulfate permease